MKHTFGKTFGITLLAAAAFAVGTLAPAPLRADQPHMQAALEALERAERELNEATHDKGGHRNKALDHVHAAIKEVRKGIGYDRHH